MFKVMILSIHPAPYRDVVFEALERRRQIGFMVYHYFPIDHGHREWGWVPLSYPHLFSSRNRLKLFFKEVIHFDILWQVMRQRYDVVVVPGYSRLTSILAILIARVRRKPVILTLDTSKRNSRRGLLELAKGLIKRSVLRICQGYWVPGFATTQYLVGEGVYSNIITQGAYCLDTPGFANIVDEVRKSRLSLRKELSIDKGARVVLAVGKMTAFRKYDTLVKSWAELNTENVLLFVGDGPMWQHLISLVERLGLSNVRFSGPCSTADLPNYFALSDAYVHPGAEPFSTALELAASAGLPVLTNEYVGYTHELLQRGCSPLLFDIKSSTDLGNKLKILLSDAYHSTNPGEALSKAALTRTPDWAARELESLVFALTK